MFQEIILQELKEAEKTLNQFINDPSNVKKIEQAADLMAQSIVKGGKIISCGNGGSHCDAMHFAEELTGRYRESRKPLPAISISDSSHITCVGNDYGYDSIFSKYVEALGKPGDVLLGISTSGNSANVLNAVEMAKKNNLHVVGLTGKNGGKIGPLCDVEIRVAHQGYADRVQEIHIKIIHIFILLIEKKVIG